MTAEQALYQRLASDPNLAAIVGDRIYPDEAPVDAAVPHLTYLRTGYEPFKDLLNNVQMARHTFQVDVYSYRKTEMLALITIISARSDGKEFDGHRCYLLDWTSAGDDEEGYTGSLLFNVWG